LREASYFVERLKADGMPLAGLVLNRVQLPTLTDVSGEEAIAAADRLANGSQTEQLTASLLRLHAQRQQIAGRQRHLAERFTAAHPGVSAATVPALAEDVHDLDGLREVGELLAPSS
jgi:anion-transporting  ArsA/GET3 family ATPase